MLWDLRESDGRSGEAAAACGCHDPAPQPDEEDDFLLFKYDITGAYKHLFLAESERPRTSVRLGQVVFESKALPFGAAANRSSIMLDTDHEKFLSLLYIDDGLLAVRRKVYWLACSLAVLVWEVLNIQTAWLKCTLGVKSVKYIGFEVSVSSTAGPSVVVHDDIWAGIRDLLAEFDDKRRVEAPSQLKGYLQPLYALLNIFERKKKAGRPLGTIKLSEDSKSLKAIRFWLQVVRRLRAPTSPKAAVEPRKLLFGASDASVGFLAGWISDGLHGRWFRLSTDDPVVRSWVRRYGNSSDQSPSHRDIALYELLLAA
ncbi:hypothetical protein FOZ63_009450, partial [Perkinsus olseni]